MQVSAWLGVGLIIAAFIAPRAYIVILGVLLILTDDEWLKAWVAKHAPGIATWIDEQTK